MRLSLIPIVGLLTACSDPIANCAFSVNDVTVCLDAEMSKGFCENNVGGEAFVAESSEDPTCEGLGYPSTCTGPITQQGDGVTVQFNTFQAATAEDCAAAQNGTFSTQ